MLCSRIARHWTKSSHYRVLFKSEVRNLLAPLSQREKITAASLKNDERSLPVRLVEAAPGNIRPYLKLMRWDKPIGTWLLFWPGGWGIAAAAAPGCLPDWTTVALFATGAVLLRGAGCTINDMWDRDIDSKVERTKDRPLVNGDLTVLDAWGLLAAQLTLGLVVLLQFNWYSILLGASSLGLVVTYPLAKRYTNWPQMVLGFTFNWGVLLGYSVIKGHLDWSIVPLYMGAVCWTVIYDTIYAHQDRHDDSKLGIKSTALRFDKDTKKWLVGFGATMGSMLTLSGIINDMAWPYYLSTTLVLTHLAKQIYTLDINNAKDCSEKFVSNAQIGFILFAGIVLGNLFNLKDSDKKICNTNESSVSSENKIN